MNDVHILIRNWLLSSSELSTIQGGARVWIGGLPAGTNGFNPAQGTGVTLFARGGKPDAEIGPLYNTSLQIDIWAGGGSQGPDWRAAWKTYLVLRDFMHAKDNINRGNDGYILSSLEQVGGQLTYDAESQRARVIAFYQVMHRQ